MDYTTLALCLWPSEGMKHMPMLPEVPTVKGVEPETVLFPYELTDEALGDLPRAAEKQGGVEGAPAVESESEGMQAVAERVRIPAAAADPAAGTEDVDMSISISGGTVHQRQGGSDGAKQVMEFDGGDSMGAVPWFAASSSDSDSSSGEQDADGMDMDGTPAMSEAASGDDAKARVSGTPLEAHFETH